ncbi:MAG: DNA topoisomerase IV [Gammaproteobacteria bacterium]|nr:MAG: DNA topoisomerase IV [Gammaproteobacteria bacterium]
MSHNKKLWTVTLLASAISGLTHAGDIEFTGFMSVTAGLVDDANSISFAGYSESDFTFEQGTLFGLQVSGQISDKVSATAQMVARGNENYNVEAEWAYLSYQATDNGKVRFGRLRMPLYLYSDFVDVGYAYTWVRPPSAVYYLPFNNIEGVDYYTTFVLGDFDSSLQVYYGAFTDSFVPAEGAPEAETRSRNQFGVAFTFGQDWWTVRAAYHAATLSVDVTGIPISSTDTIGSFANTLRLLGFSANADRLLAEEDDATFIGIGLSIDTGTYLLAAEHVEFDYDNTLFSKDVRDYVMVGYRTGNWLFNVTAQRTRDEATHPEAGIPAGVAIPGVGSTDVLIASLQSIAAAQVGDMDTLSFGARWDLAPNTALKFQLDDVEDNSPIWGGQTLDQRVFSVSLQTIF